MTTAPRPEISVIIPCFNGSAHVIQTINSIAAQKVSGIEIIFVDDGSTDDTSSKVKALNLPFLTYIFQKNQGVSAARNNGLARAAGEYLVFFDADDQMSENFLSTRIVWLKNNPMVDFVSGKLIHFNLNGYLKGHFRGTSSRAIDEILLYDSEVSTCPSGYMFRRSFLSKHSLNFNTKLSSTADRYFIIECAEKGTGSFDQHAAPLLYRVSENSMSHRLTPALAKDNDLYYQELIINAKIPPRIRTRALFAGFFILFATYWKINRKARALGFAAKAFLVAPGLFFSKILNRRAQRSGQLLQPDK